LKPFGFAWCVRKELFAASRIRKAAPNDADSLRKYLSRLDLDWHSVRGA
jgi:transcriptional regulatory protein RtcR